MSAPSSPAAPPSRAAILVPFGVVTLIWGSTWLVIRDQLAVVPAGWSVTYRFLIAGAAMTALALARRDGWRIGGRGLAFALAVGALQFCANFNLVYQAERHITSGLVAVMFALLLVPNAILARLILGQRMSGRLMLGSGIAMAGVALLFLHEARMDHGGGGQTAIGIGCTLLGVAAASCANVLQGTATARRYAMAPTLGIAMLLGAALDGALALAVSGPPRFDPHPRYVAELAYLGLCGSALAFPLYYRVVRAIGPARAAYSNVIVPVIAMLLSTLFEGYRWSPLAAAGALLAGAGRIVALGSRRIAPPDQAVRSVRSNSASIQPTLWRNSAGS